MSHLHIPDGIISPVFWIPGYLVTFFILFLLIKKMDNEEVQKKIPLTGVSAAIMLVAMSVPLGIIPAHLSLAVLTALIVGPGLGFIAVFVVNVTMALLGHGGVTIIGLNTLVIGSEVLISYFLFRNVFNNMKLFNKTFISTAIALIVSVILMLSLVSLAGDFSYGIDIHGNEENHIEDDHLEESGGFLLFKGWSAVAVILFLGVLLESLVTALILRYLSKVRPDIIAK